jgi:5-methylcytosine-specific restriction endonuclease McrA
MPIDYSNYPANWADISRAVREDAGWRCEFCGAIHGQPHPETGSLVILTVAHLDHDTTHNTRDNLRALCQRCHLRYDRHLHAQHAAETRRRRKVDAGQLEMEI